MATPVTNPLFEKPDLESFLDEADASDARVAMVERIVWGLIKPKIKPLLGSAPAERPSPLDDTVFSIAVQMGAILYDNPAAISQSGTAADSTVYRGGELADLLEQLDAYVTDQGDGGSDGVPAPRGRFPQAKPYPDPARGGYGYGYPRTYCP